MQINLGPKASNVTHKDDSFLDMFASAAMDDMFQGEKGQQVKETFEQTGRIIDPAQLEQPSQRGIVQSEAREVSSYHVVKPMDYKQISKAVNEEALVEALVKGPDNYDPVKQSAIDDVAKECKAEAQAQLSKILKSLR